MFVSRCTIVCLLDPPRVCFALHHCMLARPTACFPPRDFNANKKTRSTAPFVRDDMCPSALDFRNSGLPLDVIGWPYPLPRVTEDYLALCHGVITVCNIRSHQERRCWIGGEGTHQPFRIPRGTPHSRGSGASAIHTGVYGEGFER